MGSFMSYLPSAIHVYGNEFYDPFKPQQNKVNNPNGARALSLPLAIKEQGQVSPTFFPFFTSNVYRQSWNTVKTMAFNTDRVELDPTLYRDYRPGASMQWVGGVYYNEAVKTPSGPKNIYEYMVKTQPKRDCACKH